MAGPRPDDPLHDLLVWAAGAPIKPPILRPEDVTQATDFLDRHCLLGRFLHRARANAPVPGGAPLVEQVAKEQAEVLRRIEEQLAAVGEVASRAGEDVQLVVLKGMATYQLVGDPRVARTGDVDIVTADGERLAALLPSMGFVRTRDAFLHEIGEFTRGAVEVDLHSHFPVNRIPSPVRDADARPSAHASRWFQRGDAEASSISVDHFLATARPGRGDVPDGVRFAGPEVLVVVLAAHAYMNFTNIWSISHRAKPYVRLGELVDIADLVALPEFDQAELNRLAQEVGAGDALRWANTVAMVLLGDIIVPGWGDGTDPFLPRCLWWELWVDVEVDTHRLLVADWLAMADLVGALGATPVPRGDVVRARPAADDGGPGRVLATSHAAPAFEVALSDGHRRRIEVRVPNVVGSAELRIRVDMGSSALEWSRRADGRETAAGTLTSATWHSDDAGGTFHVDLPGDDTLDPCPLLVGVSRLDTYGSRETTLIPLAVALGP